MDDTTEDMLRDLEEYHKTGQYKQPAKEAKEIKKEKKKGDSSGRKEVVIKFRMPKMPGSRAIERVIYTLVILALLYFAFVKPINKECISMPSFSLPRFSLFGRGGNETTTEAIAEEVSGEEEEVANETANITERIEPVRPTIANLTPTSELSAEDFDFTVGNLAIDKRANETVKVKDVKFTIKNKGAGGFTGFVEAYMYDEATKEDMENFKRGERIVAVNAGSSATYSVAISPSVFRNLAQEKTIVLLLKDSEHELIKKATDKISLA